MQFVIDQDNGGQFHWRLVGETGPSWPPPRDLGSLQDAPHRSTCAAARRVGPPAPTSDRVGIVKRPDQSSTASSRRGRARAATGLVTAEVNEVRPGTPLARRRLRSRLLSRAGRSLRQVDHDAIRTLVMRLSRPRTAGGEVIERAAILAEGADSAAVLTWIAAHPGDPDDLAPRVSGRGLHSARVHDSGGADPRTPLRYVRPPGALS